MPRPAPRCQEGNGVSAKRSKFVLVTWSGPTVSRMKKAQVRRRGRGGRDDEERKDERTEGGWSHARHDRSLMHPPRRSYHPRFTLCAQANPMKTAIAGYFRGHHAHLECFDRDELTPGSIEAKLRTGVDGAFKVRLCVRRLRPLGVAARVCRVSDRHHCDQDPTLT